MRKIKITQTLKPGILDPEGSTIRITLERFGYPVTDFHIGREMYMELDVDDDEKALEIGHDAAQKVLVSTILNDYTVELVNDER